MAFCNGNGNDNNGSSPNGKCSPLANSSSHVVVPKRQEYLPWDDYFLLVALLSSMRSKDPKSPSGACIVDGKNRIVGIGYSGFPRGCPDDIFPWHDARDSTADDANGISGSDGCDRLHTKHPYLCHAITNAILNKCSNDVVGCRVYALEFPTSESVKVMIQSGIQEVVILDKQSSIPLGNKDPGTGRSEDLPKELVEEGIDSVDIQASKIMLDMAGVAVRYYQPTSPFVSLNFTAGTLTGPTNTGANSDTDAHNTEIARIKEKETRQRSMNLLMYEANYDARAVVDNGKRKSFLSWQDYFMAMAFLTAQRSKDPNTQVGACIVDSENRIIGLGYNGFPSGCSDDKLPWARSNSNQLHNKYLYVCHAEVNAILNKGSANVKGATIYVALFPCENCSKMIIQAGIRKVVYMSDTYHNTLGCRASRIMLQCAGVELRQYTPSRQRLDLDFANIE